jgi:hypothetical protein
MDILTFFKNNWIVILFFFIAFVVIIILLLNRKNATKREYYNELARQKGIMTRELAFNKSDYNYLVLKTALGKKKYLGQIIGYRTENVNFRLPTLSEEERKDVNKTREFNILMDIRNKILGVNDDKQEAKISTITFSVKTKRFKLAFIDFWHGEQDIFITETDWIHYNPVALEIECDDDIGFKYRDGRYISTKGKVDEWFNEYETYRMLHDHTVNAFAYQQLRFAEIKDENAQMINIKEKEAEIEDRKRKTMLERS